MARSDLKGDYHIVGNLSAQSLDIPAGTIVDADVSASADIAATKLEHQHHLVYSQANGSDVASETKDAYLAPSAGTIESVEVCPETAPTGGDKQYTVDLQKASNGSTSFATVLSAVVMMSSADSDGTKEAGTVSVTSYSAGDRLRWVVTASGSTGSQGQGVVAVAKLREAP